MKTKNKTFALLEIAVVLCLVFLVTLPGIAAADQNVQQEMQKVIASEVTTASEDDYILEIYGNANEDDTIDMRDFTYTARIILGLEEETDLADANFDGEITVGDMAQIGLIILGREHELTLIDSCDRIVTVSKPVERVIIDFWIDAAVTLQSLKAEDVVVGVTDVIVNEPILFPELSELPCIGVVYWPDYEKILELEPDVVLIGTDYMTFDEIQDTIQSLNPDIVVLRFDYAVPSSYADEVTKLGYIFDREEEAEELIDFIEGHLSTIEEKVSDIPDDERVKVYVEWWGDYSTTGSEEYIEMAGGNNIFSEIVGYPSAVDREVLIERDPEVIIRLWGGGYQTDDVTEMRNKRDEIMDRPGFDAVAAVDSERVYMCYSNIIVSSTYFVGVSYYAKWFYPEEFKDFDPNAIHQEYLDRFMGIDFDLNEHGVFVYHPEEHPSGR